MKQHKLSNFIAVCVCGRICTSSAGLTLHQVNCPKVAECKRKKLPITQETNIIEHNVALCRDVQGFVDLVNEMSIDAHNALQGRSKSAGRRARSALLDIRKMITPLRSKILVKMKGK